MSSNILDKIVEDQISKNSTIATPTNSEFTSLLTSLEEYKNLKYNSSNSSSTLSESSYDDTNIEKEDNIDSTNTIIQQLNPNTYDSILEEIQENESSMIEAIKDADELSKAIKDSLLYYLNIRKPNRNGILMNGISDALNASAKLLDISVNGRYKLASMKKLRATIIKDRDSSINSKSENLSLLDLLNES